MFIRWRIWAAWNASGLKFWLACCLGLWPGPCWRCFSPHCWPWQADTCCESPPVGFHLALLVGAAKAGSLASRSLSSAWSCAMESLVRSSPGWWAKKQMVRLHSIPKLHSEVRYLQVWGEGGLVDDGTG